MYAVRIAKLKPPTREIIEIPNVEIFRHLKPVTPGMEDELKRLFDIQDKTVEHADSDAPTHYTNENLGDIFRELTSKSRDPSDEYISEKIESLNRRIAQGAYGKQNAVAENSRIKWVSDPRVMGQLAQYLAMNQNLQTEVKTSNISPERKELLSHLVLAQRLTVLRALGKVDSTSYVHSLQRVINEVELKTGSFDKRFAAKYG